MRISLFRVNVVACNPQREDRVTPPIDVLVDTGAELTWLPAELLERIGIQPRRKRTFQTATKQLIERDVGYAIMRAEGYETTEEVVFALPTDLSLLGVRTIEGFGVTVDNLAHRFVATTTLVATAREDTPARRMNQERPSARQAIARLRQLRVGSRLKGLKIKALRHEGRP